MSRETIPTLPPLEYLPEAARTNTIQSQLAEQKPKRGGYIDPGTGEQAVDFYSELNDKNSRSMEKFKKMAKSNPLVPIGCLFTVGVLANGILAMRNKDQIKSQRMMRYRVLSQGATVFALVIGTFWSQWMYHPKE